MRVISAAVDIEASPARIWAVLAETGSYGAWSNQRFISFRSKVLVAHPGFEVLWSGRLPVPGLLSWIHGFDLTDCGDGTTRVLRSLILRGLLASVVCRPHRVAIFEQDMDALGEALRKRVEAS